MSGHGYRAALAIHSDDVVDQEVAWREPLLVLVDHPTEEQRLANKPLVRLLKIGQYVVQPLERGFPSQFQYDVSLALGYHKRTSDGSTTLRNDGRDRQRTGECDSHQPLAMKLAV